MNDASSEHKVKAELYRKQLQQLRRELASMQNHWNGRHRLLLLCLLGIPVLFFHLITGLLVMFFGVWLYLTQVYLLTVRMKEWEQRIAMAESEIAHFEALSAQATS